MIFILLAEISKQKAFVELNSLLATVFFGRSKKHLIMKYMYANLKSDNSKIEMVYLKITENCKHEAKRRIF